MVGENRLIDFAHNRMPRILRTHRLTWFLEHTAPTPLGAQVGCHTRATNAGGSLNSFQFEAQDEHEVIARGIHKLKVIEAERLAKEVHTKAQ